MNNILFIGDLHLSPRTPISRKDDYPQTLLNKLDSLKSLIPKYQIKHLVFLGDLFNTRHMTLSYFTKCFNKFKELKDLDTTLHLIVGNHDILYNNDSTLTESPIALLFDSGLFSKDTSFSVSGEPNTQVVTMVQLFDYTLITSNIPKAQPNYYSILVGHYFYNSGFGDDDHTITQQQAKDLGYNAYVLGHDHTPYDPVIKSTYQVHRPGSFSRGTSQTCQINRENIKLTLYSPTTQEWTYLDLPNVLPPSDVYKEVSLINKVTMSEISDSLQQLLSALDFNNSSDIMDTLNSIPMEDEVRNIIISYLNNEGIYERND